MATQTITFTKGTLDKLKHSGSGTDRYRDARFPNLYMEVGAKTKTWRFRKFQDGKNTVRTIGTWPLVDYLAAGREVGEQNEAVNEGRLPATAKQQVTLREAFDRHTRNPIDPRTKIKRQNTIYDYENTLNNHVADWLDLSILKIRKAMVNDRIRSLAHKPTTATKLLRILSSIYANELMLQNDLEHDPTHGVQGFGQREDELLFDVDKPWPVMDLVAQVKDRRQRAFWGAVVFTGIRPGHLRTIEWEHLDLDAKQLTIPRLKNDLKRTFPLSDPAVAAFKSLPRIHDRWVFASVTRDTPMVVPRPLGDPNLLRPKDGRSVFSTGAALVGLSEITIKHLRGDKVVAKGAVSRYIKSAGSHDDVNAVAQQIVSKSTSSFDVAESIFSA